MKLTVGEIAGFSEDTKRVQDYLASVQVYSERPVGYASVEQAVQRIRRLANRLMVTEVRVS